MWSASLAPVGTWALVESSLRDQRPLIHKSFTISDLHGLKREVQGHRHCRPCFCRVTGLFHWSHMQSAFHWLFVGVPRCRFHRVSRLWSVSDPPFLRVLESAARFRSTPCDPLFSQACEQPVKRGCFSVSTRCEQAVQKSSLLTLILYPSSVPHAMAVNTVGMTAAAAPNGEVLTVTRLPRTVRRTASSGR